MSSYDYEEEPRKHRHHHHRDREVIRETVRDDRSPRYTTVQETYVKKASPSPVLATDSQYVSRQTELIRRPAAREDSVTSIEEVRRDFPPPGSDAIYYRGVDDRRGSSRRARSVEREEYDAYSRRSRGDLDRKGRQNLVVEEQVTRRRSLSRNQKIIAGVAGAALAVGGKELWDRRQAAAAGDSPRERNVLGTAAVGAAGAFAAYEGMELYSKHGGKMEEKVKHYAAFNGKDGPAEVYYSTDEEVDEKPKKKSRRKSIVEGALGLVGAGAAAKALGGGGGGDRDRDRDRDHRDRRSDKYDSRSRSRTRKGENVGAAKLQQAAKAALLAGAVEAFRVRKEPGGWGGAKAQRIITAAIGSGAVDAVADNNPDKHSKRHILESVIGGLAANRAVNGSRKDIEEDGRGSSRGGRSRSRSRSRGGAGAGGGLAALATAAAAGLAGKKLLDNRSRSRSRRRRSPSEDSYNSRSPSPRRGGGKDRHKRSKSVTDMARKGLAAIGLGEAVDNGRSRDVDETRVSRKTRYTEDSDSDYDRRSHRGGNRGDPYGDSRYADSRSTVGGGGASRREKDGKKNRRKAEGKNSNDGSSSDLGSSSGDEKARKKMKGKQLLTAGLATVATIHAAHNVYASMEKRKARQKAVAEGEMSPEEAKKLKSKATMQDMASIGIAALGIKGAVSEWKEMQEMRHEYSEFCEKKDERHKKRLERQGKNKKGNGGGRRRSDNWETPGYSQGPQYIDNNPYTALPHPPAPPVNYGYGDR